MRRVRECAEYTRGCWRFFWVNIELPTTTFTAPSARPAMSRQLQALKAEKARWKEEKANSYQRELAEHEAKRRAASERLPALPGLLASALEIRIEIRDLLTLERYSDAHAKFVELLAEVRAIRDLQEWLWGVVLSRRNFGKKHEVPQSARDARDEAINKAIYDFCNDMGKILNPIVNDPTASALRMSVAGSKAYSLMLWFEVRLQSEAGRPLTLDTARLHEVGWDP